MLTCIISGLFAPAFALKIDVKQMHLVIAGADSPSAIDDEDAVTPPFAAFVLEPERAYMNPKPGRGGSLPHLRHNDVLRLWSPRRRSAPAIAVQLASHFGRAEHIRAARLRSVDRLHHTLRI